MAMRGHCGPPPHHTPGPTSLSGPWYPPSQHRCPRLIHTISPLHPWWLSPGTTVLTLTPGNDQMDSAGGGLPSQLQEVGKSSRARGEKLRAPRGAVLTADIDLGSRLPGDKHKTRAAILENTHIPGGLPEWIP